MNNPRSLPIIINSISDNIYLKAQSLDEQTAISFDSLFYKIKSLFNLYHTQMINQQLKYSHISFSLRNNNTEISYQFE